MNFFFVTAKSFQFININIGQQIFTEEKIQIFRCQTGINPAKHNKTLPRKDIILF